MNKGDLTNNNDNKVHARKGKSLMEFNAKKYFSNLIENSKFTFYCQNQFLPYTIYDRMMAHQAAQLKYV